MAATFSPAWASQLPVGIGEEHIEANHGRLTLQLAGGRGEHFAPVKVNDTLTFLFQDDTNFESHHYAFHVSDAEFDAILQRVKEAGLVYGGAPWSADDKRLNDWGGGRGVYFRVSDSHLLELMTVPQ